MALEIISDQLAATALLQEISKLCAGHGAQWHPKFQVEVSQGDMRVLAPLGVSGPLISMPTALFVPTSGAQWSNSPKAMELLESPRDATTVQRELLHLHVELYNTTRKLGWWINRHPRRLIETFHNVAACVELLKPGYQAWPELSAAEGFLSTRVIRGRTGPKGMQRQKLLMPLIDIFNHHHQGSSYRAADGMMLIKAKQAVGRECFVHYGNRLDVLDIALHYGYCDLTTPFAHSAPLKIEVEGIGSICIEHQGRRAPFHPFDPPRVAFQSDGLRLSHLCFDQDHPGRVQMMLRLALQAHLKHRGYIAASALKMVHSALGSIAEANLLLLKQLCDAAQASLHPGAPILMAAAQRQACIIKAVFCR